ncbi:nickel-responsive transcriptional regulator NikR [Helicobacter sp. 16-1353]|uniref:nickel-responsive transcriptional regulator NikR n=1 Tax=Helicobacter sp. 16-1353 TaxID=2004996 RepID=UPI000DCDE089|nr:nickel-responsive transcriptional regulator NikR [Helicobacter sp. 16-1353]RAX54751.1 nickel-responsive transcriptional regulator NikR [Helicobacter sp. 16-1353]
MDKNTLTRFSISLPYDLLDELDKRIINNGYSSRSELIRDMIREKMVDEKWENESDSVELVAVLTIIYDHHQRELNQKIIDIQHNSIVKILCTTHIHLNHNNCLESIMLKGSKSDIENLSLSIGGLKGVKFYKIIKTSSF